eukprot:86495-Chlamydomonas_euryale.AAC.4
MGGRTGGLVGGGEEERVGCARKRWEAGGEGICAATSVWASKPSARMEPPCVRSSLTGKGRTGRKAGRRAGDARQAGGQGRGRAQAASEPEPSVPIEPPWVRGQTGVVREELPGRQLGATRAKEQGGGRRGGREAGGEGRLSHDDAHAPHTLFCSCVLQGPRALTHSSFCSCVSQGSRALTHT